MNYYSTEKNTPPVSFEEALFIGLPPDNGLYMPEEFREVDNSFYSVDNFVDLSYLIAKTFLDNLIKEEDLYNIISDCYNFPVPLIELKDNIFSLELFHGPTAAFKDFGARFMSRIMSCFLKGQKKKITILVATSGDTGSAVANGFYKVDNIDVVILYPKGKVSLLQEKQLTTLGENITALEVNGNFDDCQRMVKEAFLDQELCSKINLSSANSINIGRLYPQSFYYFWSFNVLYRKKGVKEVVFCVPSGNFGNLTAGVFAKKMGTPVKKFIAGTNINDVVPEFLYTGVYAPRASKQTLSNAMDVGNPSNFKRLIDIYKTKENMVKEIIGYKVTDAETLNTIERVYKTDKYLLDPHGAVGYKAIKMYKKDNTDNIPVILLETAHPAKFKDSIENNLKINVDIPESLKKCLNKDKKSIEIDNKYGELKNYLTTR